MRNAEGWNDIADFSVGQERDEALADAGKSSPSRRHGGPYYIVVHITGCEFAPAHARFTNVAENVSPHYLIKTNGDILQYVKDELGANHAGIKTKIIAAYKDGTWRRFKRNNCGVSLSSSFLDASARSAPTKEDSIYSVLVDGSDWPIYAKMEELARKRIGDIRLPYYPSPTDEEGNPTITGDAMYEVNRNSLGIEIEGAGHVTDAQYASLIRLVDDLCVTHGIPYDAQHVVGHEDVNPCDRFGWDPGAIPDWPVFDWPRVYAGTDWTLPEGPPPVIAPRGFSLVRSPLGDAAKSPLRAFLENEASYGGFFPLGLRGNTHSGIHVYPPQPEGGRGVRRGDPAELAGDAARCMLPGWLVAARLAPSTRDSDRLIGAHRGFALLRHELQERGDDGEPVGDPFALYSLYMHLAPPANWDAIDSDRYARVPWLARLLRTRLGSIVTVGSRNHVPGTTFWLAEEPAELKGTVKVLPPGGAGDPVEIVLEGPEGAVLAVRRPPPADPAQALQALKAGNVATFSAPYLTVRAGEELGYVEPVQGFDAFPSGFLHWEVLAPAEAGVKQLLDLAVSALGLPADFFPVVEDEHQDNVWTKEELNEKLKPLLPQVDRDALGEDGLFKASFYEGAMLWMLHHRAPLSFADQSVDDGQWEGRPAPDEAAPTAQEGVDAPPPPQPKQFYEEAKLELTYPLVVKIENYQELLKVGEHQVRFRVTFEPEGLGEGTVAIEEDAAEWTVKLQVPAAARRVVLHPEGDLHLDTQVIEVAQAKELYKQSLETLLPYRWRHVCLRHVSPWSLKGMRAAIAARYAPEVLDLLVPGYGAVAWWDLGDGTQAGEDEVGKAERDPSWKEVAVLGAADQEQSIFGGLLPDKAGRVDNVHPVTASWLINLLVELKKLAVIERWAPFDGSGEGDPWDAIHCGWGAAKPLNELALGDEVTALVIARGYGSDAGGVQHHEAALLAESGDGVTRRLGSVPFVEGVAKTTTRLPLWGEWTLKVEGQDDVGGEIPAKIEVARPSLVEAQEPSVSPSAARWVLRFDPAPSALEGWIAFKVWKCEADAEPSGDQDPVGIAIPIEAVPAPSELSACGPGVQLDESGLLIVGAAGANTRVPDADSNYKSGIYTTACGGTLRIAVPVARAVDRIRTAFPTGLAFPSGGVGHGGWTISFTAHRPNATRSSNLESVIKADAEASGYEWSRSGDTFTLELSAPEGTPGGPLMAEFTPAAALQRLVEDDPPGAGQVLRVAFGFLAPNGGRGVLSEGEDAALLPPPDRTEGDAPPFVDLDVGALRQKCGENDLLEVWSRPIVTLTALGFEEPVVAEVAGANLNLTARFSRAVLPSELAAALPRFVIGEKQFGEPKGNDLVASIPLTEVIALAGGAETLSVEARLTAQPVVFGGVEREVPPVPFEVSSKPRFDTPDEVTFVSGRAVIRTRVHCSPTNKVFGIEPVRGETVVNLRPHIAFDLPYTSSPGRGFPTATGELRATIRWANLRSAFAVGDEIKFRFVRPYEQGKVLDVAVDPVEVTVSMPSEEDANRAPEDEE